jgi:putative spermidine/putrescine transport system substrate-binding protein
VAAASPFAAAQPARADRAPAAFKGPLRVLTLGIEWPDGVLRAAELSLGFSINLQTVTSAEQVKTALTKPESFDVFGGYGYQAMRVWQSGNLRAIDTERIDAWPELYRLFAWGKLQPGSSCPYGVGDAPFRSLFLRAGSVGLPASSARPPGTTSIVQWIDERTGEPYGGRPMPRHVIGVPAHFAAESIGYLVDVIERPPRRVSWAELLNRRWKGRVAVQDDPGVGFLDLGRAAQSLGIIRIANLGQMTIPEIDRLAKIITAYRKQQQFRAAWSSFNDSVNLMASKDVAVSALWPSAAARLVAEGVKAEYAVPPEGYRGSCSSIGISARVVDSRTLDACYAYLNWLYEGLFGATMMRQGYYVANGARLGGWIRTFGGGGGGG